MYPDVKPLLSKLRDSKAADTGKIIVGVITNSDDRTPEIMTSLGLRVRSLRYGEASRHVNIPEVADIDFTVMSHDVGHEKPDKRMFEAAEALAASVLARDEGLSTGARSLPKDWQKIYVGDEYDKDVVGALSAGWNAVLIDREASGQCEGLQWCDEQEPSSVDRLLASASAVGFSSLAKLSPWVVTTMMQ
jgi:FMN phosphatase YigB (HAD superfamily)